MAAARYLGVPPWEMEQAPATWLLRAEVASDAEEHARQQRQKRGGG